MRLLLCFVFAAVLSTALSLTKEQKARWKKWSDECREETGVSPEQITKIRTNQFDDLNDEKIKKHALCFGTKSGLVSESGEILVDQIKEKLRRIESSDEEIDKIIKKCVVKKDTPQDSSFFTFKCVREERPNFNPV